jgi:hypothetical protein
MPANAYMDNRGTGWQCERGFHRNDMVCAAVVVPANAYLDYSGNDWQCADGFRRNEGACVPRS